MKRNPNRTPPTSNVTATPDVERTVMPLAALVPTPDNPRAIGEKEFESLKQGIARFGLVQDVVVNRRTGHIVGGHQRAKALAALGSTNVPVTVVDLSEDEERALNIQLNSPRAQGSFTLDVKGHLDELQASIGDVYASLDFQGLRDMVDVLAKGKQGANTSFGNPYTKNSADQSNGLSPRFVVVVECENESHQIELLQRLSEEGLKCRALF